jgi:hypothetical protein
MTDTAMSFREQLRHPDREVAHAVLRPLYHVDEGRHQQCRERLTAVLDLLNDKSGQDLRDYRYVVSCVPTEEFSLVIDALARTGTERLAESLEVTVHNGYDLRPRTAVLASMLASGWAPRAADQLVSGGPQARDTALDMTLLHRRARDLDAAEPLGPTFVDECVWYATPTTDQAAVLDALQLTSAVPVGFHEGARLFDAQRDRPAKAVLVTPAFDGWTLVLHDPALDLDRDLEALSARFGAAHSYGHSSQSGCGDWSDWTVAEHGEQQQSCYLDLYGNDSMGPATRDEMLAWVNQRRRPATPRLPTAGDPYDGWNDWELNAESVAHRLSVSLARLGPHTTVKGTSLLATPIVP